MSNSEITMTNPNPRIFYDNVKIGRILLDNDHENVLSHIYVEEDQRGQGYSRQILNEWLDWCISNGYEESYVIMVKSPAIKHVLTTLNRYNYEKVSIRQVPGDIEPGHDVSRLSYKITPKY
jgi:GNAT superfamily N-acetyltransferase